MMKVPLYVGFNLHFQPDPNNHGALIILGPQPMDARVVFVHNDTLVNLVVFDHTGAMVPMQGIPVLYQPHDIMIPGGFCELPDYGYVTGESSSVLEASGSGVVVTNAGVAALDAAGLSVAQQGGDGPAPVGDQPAAETAEPVPAVPGDGIPGYPKQPEAEAAAGSPTVIAPDAGAVGAGS